MGATLQEHRSLEEAAAAHTPAVWKGSWCPPMEKGSGEKRAKATEERSIVSGCLLRAAGSCIPLEPVAPVLLFVALLV